MKKLFFIIILFLLIIPVSAYADESKTDEAFKARVIEIIEEKENELPDGTKAWQQNIKLLGLSGKMEGKEFVFEGINSFDVLNKNLYKTGDKVIVIASLDHEGNVSYYITDFLRTKSLLWLFIVFAAILLIIGRGKGLRSLVSLFVTFFIIIYFLIPQALSGGSLIWPTLICGVAILTIVIYLTEGINKRSHIAVACTTISLVLTVFISWLFVGLSRLSGLGSEEIAHLINIGDGFINFKGLLLSGIIIGSLGVLDDVIISQVAAVEQIHKTNADQSPKELTKKAMDIGTSHIGSMANTLFLAYAGASLPLLILFVSEKALF